jgi:HME family heavy-metal exporter
VFRFLVDISLKARLLVVVIAAATMVYGGMALRDLPIDVLPNLDKGIITILTEAPGFAPEEVEVLVSYPIESAMNGANGVTRVRSVSSTSLSVVYVEFAWDTDIYTNRQIVAERLGPVQLELPAGVQPLMAPISSYMGEIMLVALSSNTLDSMALREVADWVVGQRVKAVPGVSRVVAIGGLVKEYRVTLDSLRMSQLKVSLEEVLTAIDGFGGNTGGGFVDRGAQEFLIRNLSRTQNIEDLRNTVVVHRVGQPVLLRQIAEIAFKPKQRRGDGGFMGEPAVILSIHKQPQADTVELTKRVEKVLASLQETMPAGTRVNDYLFRQADFIHASVHNLQAVLTEAIVVVAIILFLFLFNARTTLISLLAIPVSVLTTFIVLRTMGLTINTMTLGGLAIAIGELVDDAVVDVENIFRRLRDNIQRLNPRPALEVIATASQEVRSSIVYSTIIIVLVFLPMFTLQGIEGRLFGSLGVAYIVSILASLITSITLTPVLCSYLLPKMKGLVERESVIVRGLKRLNARLLGWVLDRPIPVMSTIAIAIVVASAVVPMLPRAFLPPFNEGTLLIEMTLQPGISLDESARIASAAERLLLTVPEVVKVGRRTGRSESDEHAKGVHVSEIDVAIKRSSRNLNLILADIRSHLGGLPAAFNIGQPMTHRLIENVLTGVPAELAVKIFGDDLDTLRTLAGDVERWLKTIPGLPDVVVERQVPVPQIQVQVDPARALLYGLRPGEVAARLAQLANGVEVAEIVDGIKRFDLVVRLDDDARSAEHLSGLLLDTPAGQIPVSLVAQITETSGPNQVSRENNQRRIVVMANGDGSDNNLIAAEILEMMEKMTLPVGYYMTFEGIYAEQTRSALRLGALTIISLSLVFVILFMRYKSAILAAIVIANVPLALIGSVIAIKLAGLDLSIATIIGFVTLTGISTRNGLLKISHYINLVLHEGEHFGRGLIVRGANERLVPVLMTALSAAVALLPLLFGSNEAGREILHPVAVVIFGGLISSTALDMILTPLLFHRFAQSALERLRSSRAVTAMEGAY